MVLTGEYISKWVCKREKRQKQNALCLFCVCDTSSALSLFISTFPIRDKLCVWHTTAESLFPYVAGMECHTVRQITTPSMGWNVRLVADTSVEGFWRWERNQISTWDEAAAAAAAAAQKSKSRWTVECNQRYRNWAVTSCVLCRV